MLEKKYEIKKTSIKELHISEQKKKPKQPTKNLLLFNKKVLQPKSVTKSHEKK